MKRIWIYLFVIFWLVPDAISQTGQIRGKVFDFRQNQFLVGQLIVLERHQAEQTSRRETETDAEGHYRFQNLAQSWDPESFSYPTKGAAPRLKDDPFWNVFWSLFGDHL